MTKKTKTPQDPARALKEEIIKVFNKYPNRSFNYKQVSKHLGIKEKSFRLSLIDILYQMLEAGDLIEIEKGKFLLKPVYAYVEGVIDVTASGAAYLMSDDYEDDIFIAPRNVKNALHGDKVKICLLARKPGSRLEGEVVEVLERSKSQFAGTLQVSGKFAFLVPDSNRMLVDIFIPLKDLNGGENGHKAVAEITEWQPGAKNPVGKIVEILGWPGENETEMNSILVEYGFPLRFPEGVEKEAEKIPVEISKKEIESRRDFRDITTFTIDPVDAKDFDDALSIRKLDDSETGARWEIGIHIADVTHYVRPGTALDDEAQERATSIYLVDRVIPMLPEKLSNNVCSLRPNEEKLCFSAVFEIDEEANVLNRWFGKTIIYSNHRFSYEEAQTIIETGQGTFADELKTLDTLAKKLRKERFRQGAIAFEKVEVRFKLDAKGNPLGVYLKESKDSNKLIEEFMLLANREVAEYAGKVAKKKHSGEEVNKRTFVYRVHNAPVLEKLTIFAGFAAKFGYKINTRTDKEIAASLNKLLKDISGKKEQNVLEQIAIRTMAKAVYSTDNIGHYGLAFDYYTHFTSPIRRYPDMMVHRLLQHYLAGGESPAETEFIEQCKHSTDMEIQASEAERASIKYKQVQFLLDKIGVEFDGIISGVTERGIFVEIIENKCEGMVRLRDINNDFYEFDESNYCITGHRTGKTYQLGDQVVVRVKNADLARKQIDMELVMDDDNSGFAPRDFYHSRKGKKSGDKKDRDKKSKHKNKWRP